MKRRRRKIVQEHELKTATYPYWFHGSLLVIWWFLLVGLVTQVDPEIVKDIGWSGSYLPLFILIFLAVGWLVGIVRRQIGKGLWWGLLVSLALFLNHIGLGTWFNLVLLLCLGLTAEWYWRLNGKKSRHEENMSKQKQL